LGAKIEGVTRTPAGGRIHFEDHPPEYFDEVVFACHAPQTLQLLQDITPVERQVLSGFRTSRNETVLHTDSSLLPRRPGRVHRGTIISDAAASGHADVSHEPSAEPAYAGRLLCEPEQCSVVDERRILREMTYFHPLYTLEAVRAQARWRRSVATTDALLRAYWFYGFHEDG